MSTRVPSAVARERLLAAARELLREQPFSALTVGAVMDRAGLARTVFYRHYTDLPDMAADLLPDSGDPLVDRVARAPRDQRVPRMLAGLVDLYAEHGPLLRAIDDAARHDPAVAERLDTALVGPRALMAELAAGAPHPPPDPEEFARVLMAAHNGYLLGVFGAGPAPRGAKAAARRALAALWERLLS